MDQQPIPARQQPWRFTLASLMAAVVFVGCACAAGRFYMVSIDPGVFPFRPPGAVWSLFTIPVSLSGAVGVLHGELKRYLSYGVMLDLVLFGILLLSLPNFP